MPLIVRVLSSVITSKRSLRSNPIKSCDCDASLAMTKQIATVVSLPRDDKFCNESCTAKRSNLIKKYAFTLAEVLITLGIIGVVAAITLPILVQNYQKKVTVERLKQTYSILSQAIKMSEIDNGPVEEWNIPTESNAYEHGKQFSEQYITPYIKKVKVCSNAINCHGEKTYYLSGQESGYNKSLYYIILNNGVVMYVWPRSTFIEFGVNINGKQKPNVAGKDIFVMLLSKYDMDSGILGKFKKGTLSFYGQGHDRNYLKTRVYPCAKSGTLAGVYCGALIFLDGWQIAKDYPW